MYKNSIYYGPTKIGSGVIENLADLESNEINQFQE